MDNNSLRHHRLSFRDIMCGYVCLDGVTKEHEKSFCESLEHFKFFPDSRTIKKMSGGDFVIYTNSFVDDTYETKNGFSAFVGFASTLSSHSPLRRDLAKYFANRESWMMEDFNQFIDSRFSGITIDRTNRQIRLCSDFFGKRKLFYKNIDNVCYFSNELQTLLFVSTPNETIDRQALRSYLSLGTSLGNRTISNLIKSVPLQHYVTFDGQKTYINKLEQANYTQNSGNLDAVFVYEQFKSVLKFLTQELNFTVSDLSGGADTRLTLAGLRDLGTKMVYTCDKVDHPEDINDYKVMRSLEETFALSTQVKFLDSRSSKKFHKNKFETHRHYEGDIYDRRLSGMFGGELFGGWVLTNFFSDSKIYHFKDLDRQALELFPDDYFSSTQSFEEEIAQLTKTLTFSDPLTLLSISMLYASPLYYRESEDSWLEAYLLTSRKISAFLGDAVIRSLDTQNSSQQLIDYQFYHHLYTTCAKEMLEPYFYSNFALMFPETMKDIRTSPQQPQTTSISESKKTTVEKTLLEKKIHQISKYLTDQKVLQLPELGLFHQ